MSHNSPSDSADPQSSQDMPASSQPNATADQRASIPTDALWFYVQLRPGSRSKHRRRYFEQLERHLSNLGLVVAQATGLCIVLSVNRDMVLADRHAVVNWLIDQPRTWAITLGGLCSSVALRDGDYPLEFQDLEGEPPPELVAAARAFVSRLVRQAGLKKLMLLMTELKARQP